MHAYLFTAAVSYSQVRETDVGRGLTANRLATWDSCTSLIMCGDNSEEAQTRFEAWLRRSPQDENPVQTEIRRLVAAQFMDQLLTESGHEPVDWTRISERVEPTLPSVEGEDFDQGYWADVNQLVQPGKLAADLGALERDLLEDTRSGLNWSADRQFFFIVSVLSPRLPPSEPDYEMESELANPDHISENSPVETDASDLELSMAELSELQNKEVAALVQARNSVAAAWLWRKFAADTPYATNDIHIHAWCGVQVPERTENFLGEHN